MTGKEIRALRGTLGLSVGALGSKLGVEAATVLGWEREELFPTKRALESLMALQGEAEGKDEGVRRSEDEGVRGGNDEGRGKDKGVGSGEDEGVIQALADPAVWELLRKVLAYPELRLEVERIAAGYPDPVKTESE